jgi:hypothetical protein
LVCNVPVNAYILFVAALATSEVMLNLFHVCTIACDSEDIFAFTDNRGSGKVKESRPYLVVIHCNSR